MDPKTLDRIRRSNVIPPMPQVVSRLVQITQDPNFDHDELVATLETDPAVASDVLRLANSPIFGIARKIVSLKHAMALLGINRVRTLVTGRYMTSAFRAAGSDPIDRNYYWRRSLATAVLAARFAELRMPRYREEAFICGLLSDLGVIVLAGAFAEDYQSVAEHYAPQGGRGYVEREMATVGVAHPEVSAVIFEEWLLPDLVVDAVRKHHEPPNEEENGNEAYQLARLVNAAGLLARILCEVSDAETIRQTCNESVAVAQVKLSALSEMLSAVAADISEFAKLLKIEVLESKVFKLIADTISDRLQESAP